MTRSTRELTIEPNSSNDIDLTLADGTVISLQSALISGRSYLSLRPAHILVERYDMDAERWLPLTTKPEMLRISVMP